MVEELKQHKILVTYGHHLREEYAKKVGVRLRDLKLKNVVVERWRGFRGLNRNEEFRKERGAKYAIDLHDDSPLIERYRDHLPLIDDSRYRYDVFAHMDFTMATNLLYPLRDQWNMKNENRRCLASGCDCYPRYGKTCRTGVIIIEFNVAEYTVRYSYPPIGEGVEFLENFVKYLQSR